MSLSATPSRWQQLLKQAIRLPAELCDRLELPPEYLPAARRAAELFPLRVPLGFVERMEKGNPHDPLLRQVLPLAEEFEESPDFVADPVGDTSAMRAAGLLHKYHGRALLVTTGTCAVHCRYCFRRHFGYSELPRGLSAWQPALQAIESDDSLEEILLSGGDPLSLTDGTLAALAERLAAIPHLKRLRLHSRWPTLIPARVDEALLHWLTGTRLQPIMVLHINHAQEIDESVSQAIERLHAAGVFLLNQAVLLHRVNDSVAALRNLCERLVSLRVQPYYLHQLDRVQGATHFEVPVSRGLELMAALRGLLPGYAVPRYVQEIPGELSKVVLA